MTIAHVNAPRRAQPFHAKIWHVFTSTIFDSILKCTRLWSDPRQSLPRLTDHLARDIGLDPADLEWSRIKLPSQTERHPMM